ncbi:MAG: hypothetical protein MJ197_00665 [Bacteroidales bacterium]|nr:hypothetical protein [Bacteroidales bacterium]
MRKILMILLSALVMCACNKDDEPKPNGGDNQKEISQEESVFVLDPYEIQKQVIGYDWYLEYVKGQNGYNNCSCKHNFYFTFTEDEVYSIAPDDDAIEKCTSVEKVYTYTIAADSLIIRNLMDLSQHTGYVCLLNDTLCFGLDSEFRNNPISMCYQYYVKKR